MTLAATHIETPGCVLDPLADRRWSAFLERHRSSSVFHSCEWLHALRTSFGYEPIVITTAAPGEELTNGVAFCLIRSSITGSRMVSLPFSDHCEVLGADKDQAQELLALVGAQPYRLSLRYLEVRPLYTSPEPGSLFRCVDQFLLHSLDLTPSIGRIFASLHKDSVQRRIRRANGARLRYERGNSKELLEAFYALHIETRRRLGLPPFPMKWFRALAASLGKQLQIRVACLASKPIASTITLEFKETVTYKYAASDARHHRFGAMPFLLWQTVEEAKTAGMRELDFGRSERASVGLIQFKRRWGTREMPINYWQLGNYRGGYERSYTSKSLAQHIFRHTPRGVLRLLGGLYRHIG